MSERLKVLFVHHQCKMGGAERSLLSLFSGLDRGAYDVHVACPSDGPFPRAVRQCGHQHHPTEFAPLRRVDRLLRTTSRLSGLVRTHGIHLVHSNAPQTNIPGGVVSRLTGVPAVWHARNLVEKGMWDVDRMFCALADRIICNSRAIARRFEGIRRFEEKVSVIVNAVDLGVSTARPRSKTEARRRVGLPDRGFIVGLFDRLDPRKNHHTVVRAVGEARRACPDMLVLVVGEAFEHHAQLRDELMALGRELGVAEKLRMIGYREDVFDWMSACDVVVQAAEKEGCSRVLCEAQALGRPVIAAEDGGNPELVEHEKTGLLFKTNDVQALSQHLVRLCAAPETMERMGEAGMRKARKDFSLSRYVEETTRVYRSLVTSNAPA